MSNVPDQIMDPVATPPDPVASVSPVETVSQQTNTSEIPYTPEQILQLEQYAISATRRLEELKEYEEDIKRLQNPEYREFYKNATRYWEEGRKNDPQQPVRHRDPETEEILSYVREQKAREKAQHEESLNRFYAEQRIAEQKMRRDYGLNDDQMRRIAEYADFKHQREKRLVGLDEAYRDMSSISPRAGNNAPPTVGLRGDATTPGVPGPSSSNEDFKTDFHGALTARLKAGK